MHNAVEKCFAANNILVVNVGLTTLLCEKWKIASPICHFSLENVVPITHEQNIICSKTRLNVTTHEQTIICR